MLMSCACQQVTDYLDVITDPIDLQMIEKRLSQPNIYYKTKVHSDIMHAVQIHYWELRLLRGQDIFRADLKRMVDNCRTFNTPDTVSDPLMILAMSRARLLP